MEWCSALELRYRQRRCLKLELTPHPKIETYDRAVELFFGIVVLGMVHYVQAFEFGGG